MSAMKKIAGLIAGASAVAVFGVAIAQGVPPNPFVSNPALGAGQQSTHLTSMGETGVPGFVDQVQAAAITPVPQVAAVQPAPAPEPMVQAQAPAPAPVEQQTMGAGPAEPTPMKVAKADRG